MNSRLSAHAVLVATVLAFGAAPLGAQETPPRFGTTVEVTRILTEVRVVDDAGYPIVDLAPEDFRVKIDGARAEVESVTWVPTTDEAEVSSTSPFATRTSPVFSRGAAEPRLIVVLFQTDVALYRIKGVVRMAPQAADFVRNLAPSDRVALFTFESHLELRSDFTLDHEGLARMITTTEILDGSVAPPTPSGPRIGEDFPARHAREAATLSQALELVGEALAPLAGPKTLVLFGWGLGRYNRGHPITTGDYANAVASLAAARVSVFTLDITTADFHTLEIGLRRISEDTGGLYLKTHLFPDSAMDKLVRVISSYYELSIKPPPGLRHPYQIDVRVKRKGSRVYVRQNHPTGRR